LKPNYEKPVLSVYRDFARFCIRKSPRLLDILGHVQHTIDPSEDDVYPSWVPKFDKARSVSFFPPGLYFSGIPCKGHYRYFAEVHDCPLHAAPLKPNLLVLDGYRVDEVATVSEPIHFNSNDSSPFEHIWDQIFDHPLFPRSNQRYADTQEALDIAFFMVLHIGALGSVARMAHLLKELSNSRIASFDALERQAKSNLLAWLRQSPNVEVETAYPDLMIGAQGSLMDGNGDAYVRSVWGFCQNRRFYRTRSGLLGVGPQVLRPGDHVVVLFGGHLPFILRRHGDWLLVGDTYLHHADILRGRETRAVRSARGDFRTETFRLK
jgi:hypothetical protein